MVAIAAVSLTREATNWARMAAMTGACLRIAHTVVMAVFIAGLYPAS
jgi:hypothetical protein